jgi:hypothetical protein
MAETINSESEITYCSQRLNQYGISEEKNRFSVNIHEPVADKYPQAKNQPFFWPSENNGINILYLALNGAYEYHNGAGRHKQRFTRERLNPYLCTSDQKYNQPANSGVHIFFTPTIIDKYGKGESIETLYIIEGEFKAFLGYLHGIDIVGIPSIHAFKEKNDNDLHPDLKELIRVCKPQNLVILFDGDANVVKWDKWRKDPEYDLGNRLNIFYKAVFNLRDWTKNLVNDVYYTQLKEEFLRSHITQDSDETVKGLDDLLLHKKGEETDVITDLKKLSRASTYFQCFNISDESPAKIKKHFLLNRNKYGAPVDFYTRHSHELKLLEFKFLHAKYKLNSLTDELELTRHEDSNKFVRVSCDYLKIINIPNSKKILERKLIPWKVGEITRDYVNKGVKNFFDTIPKFDSFCNVPDNSETYQQVVNNCYNLYYNIGHKAELGEWKQTEFFLRHIFGEKYDIGLDYLTLLYRTPTQKLPILVLVSKERATGKSTFLWWLRELFGENTTIVGNQEITDRFNDDYASKLVIGLDEGFIEKKQVLERIKSWSTSDRIKMDTKNVSRAEISFFGKIVITSNHEDSFIHVDEEEIRFFVNKVPKFGMEDPDLLEKLKIEIPSFFYELSTRVITCPKKTRHWFHPDVIRTEALDKVKSASKSWLEKDFKETIGELFIYYKYPVLSYTIKEATRLLNENGGKRYQPNEVKRFLCDKLGLKNKVKRVQFPLEPEAQNHVFKSFEKRGRLFSFNIQDYLTEEEQREIGIPVNSSDLPLSAVANLSAKYD